jgi:nicotinamidase/pyrazinamidase|tara:strand:+ start:8895 stop:9566 length:672 start_codon:yes stop_codon:yes gene_type:complete
MPGVRAETDKEDCLIIIDVQNDFCGGGALEVPGGAEVVARINQLSASFANVVLTQDWHPADHSSFAHNHRDAAPLSTITLDYGPQTLWPRHCVQGTAGADFHPDLLTDSAQLVLRKGFRTAIDSYSAFYENDKTTATGLEGYLKSRGISRLFLCGLATDFCVFYSAMDAVQAGFQTYLIDDACRAIDLEGSLAQAHAALRAAGVTRINSAALATGPGSNDLPE